MKRNMQWVLGAILICIASLFASCSNADLPASGGEPVIDGLAEKVIGKWIVDQKEGKPALTNQKVVINFVSDSKVSVSVSFMNFWHHNDLFDYTIKRNTISCKKQLDENTLAKISVKVHAIEANTMNEDFFYSLSVDGKEQVRMESKEVLKRVTDDYSTAILGIWEGKVTSEEGSEFDDGEAHRWEFRADGSYYFYSKVNDQWQLSDDDYGTYFVDGTLLCTRWKNKGENSVENREWWEVEGIENGVMKWTALRQKPDGTTYTATFQMTKVN